MAAVPLKWYGGDDTMYVAMAVIMADAMMRCVGINRRDQASGGLREARRHDASIQAITNHQHMTQTGRATHYGPS